MVLTVSTIFKSTKDTSETQGNLLTVIPYKIKFKNLTSILPTCVAQNTHEHSKRKQWGGVRGDDQRKSSKTNPKLCGFIFCYLGLWFQGT